MNDEHSPTVTIEEWVTPSKLSHYHARLLVHRGYIVAHFQGPLDGSLCLRRLLKLEVSFFNIVANTKLESVFSRPWVKLIK